MTTDPTATAGLVTREVRTGSREGTPTRIAIARRTYATDQDDLWDVLTNAERIPRWFLPISGDLEVGGRDQLEGNAGGVIERCEQPRMFAVTWEYGDQMSWLEVTLTPAAGGTTLQLAHEGGGDPAFWEQFGPGAVGVGWDLALWGLGRHLESGATLDPATENDWSTSPEGIEFVRAAALDWAEAAIADGDEATAAREAAERTITFYTVLPEEAPEAPEA